jgi:hypothetical protein
MAAIGVVGFVVLILIYFVLKTQALNKELRQFKHSLKASDKQARNTLNSLNFLSKEMQKVCAGRLNSAKKHGLINDEDFAISSNIIDNFTYVITRCCEHGDTIEEAVNKSLERATIEIQEINHFIARQPQEIKIPWCKNQLGGYIIACQNISKGATPKKSIASAEDEASS